MSPAAWQPFCATLVLSAAIMPVIIALARRWGFTARPREDRWASPRGEGRRPPALLGGVGIFLSLAVGAAYFLPWNRQFIGIAAGAAFMFGVGLLDDLRGLRPYLKMAAQTAAACALLATGTAVTMVPIAWLAALATIFWVIAITNAVNLVDNMDGLASGVVTVSALTLAAYGLRNGMPALATLALLIAGACSGFLCYNFNPARLFMGDCGSLLLGFLMSAASLVGTARAASGLALALFVPVALLAVPVFDTTLVSVVRRLNGRPISQGGRDHSSHRMVALGLSERGTVGVLYCISAAFGLLAVASASLPTLVTLVLAALMFGALAVFGVFLGMVQVYAVADGQWSMVYGPGKGSLSRNYQLSALNPQPMSGTLLGGTLRHKKQALQLLFDVGLIPLALVAANLLRFEGALPRQILERLALGLPYVIVAKVACLALTRSYQGIWRYAGISEVIAVLKGSSLGSLLAAVVLAGVFHWEGFSRTALIIDWMAFTGLAIATRTGLVLLGHLFSQGSGFRVQGPWAACPSCTLHPQPCTRCPHRARRVVVVGANETGVAAIRELSARGAGTRLRNGSSTVPVAFLDEDQTKHHRSLNGIPVVGSVSDLPDVVRRLHADAVVIAVGSGQKPEESLRLAESVAALCDQYSIPHQRFGLADG